MSRGTGSALSRACIDGAGRFFMSKKKKPNFFSEMRFDFQVTLFILSWSVMLGLWRFGISNEYQLKTTVVQLVWTVHHEITVPMNSSDETRDVFIGNASEETLVVSGNSSEETLVVSGNSISAFVVSKNETTDTKPQNYFRTMRSLSIPGMTRYKRAAASSLRCPLSIPVKRRLPFCAHRCLR